MRQIRHRTIAPLLMVVLLGIASLPLCAELGRCPMRACHTSIEPTCFADSGCCCESSWRSTPATEAIIGASAEAAKRAGPSDASVGPVRDVRVHACPPMIGALSDSRSIRSSHPLFVILHTLLI